MMNPSTSNYPISPHLTPQSESEIRNQNSGMPLILKDTLTSQPPHGFFSPGRIKTQKLSSQQPAMASEEHIHHPQLDPEIYQKSEMFKATNHEVSMLFPLSAHLPRVGCSQKSETQPQYSSQEAQQVRHGATTTIRNQK